MMLNPFRTPVKRDREPTFAEKCKAAANQFNSIPVVDQTEQIFNENLKYAWSQATSGQYSSFVGSVKELRKNTDFQKLSSLFEDKGFRVENNGYGLYLRWE